MKYSPMWEVGNVYFHYNDKDRAGEDSVLKWVVMHQDYFIGIWQVKENFAIEIFNTEKDAESYIEQSSKENVKWKWHK